MDRKTLGIVVLVVGILVALIALFSRPAGLLTTAFVTRKIAIVVVGCIAARVGLVMIGRRRR
jgi:hypothetical protein